MRTILKRIGNDITQSKFKDDEMLQLHNERGTQSTNQAQRNLRENLADLSFRKPEKNTTTQLNNAGIKPIGIASAGKGVVYEADQTGNGIKNTAQGKTPYIPISVVTGGRDITTVPSKLRTNLLQGSPSATNAIPKDYADVANVLEKAGDVINFDQWNDLTAKQQLNIIQKSGLSEQDQQILLNTSPRYVETIAKIQDVFANRYTLGITLADARNVAKELFDIANEREEAYTRTGKYEMDAVFAPKAMQWLDEKEKEILDNLTKKAGESGKPTWYNGENSEQNDSDDSDESTGKGSSNGYIQVPGIPIIGPGRNNPPVNCYGYVLMNLGIKPSDGNYDIQPGMISETRVGDHAHAYSGNQLLNTDTVSIVEYIIRDIEKTGRDVRMIESCEEAAEGETLVALKNDNFFFGGDQYHVAIQLPDGTWADKRGIGNESRQGEIDNPDGPWAAEWWKYVYDTETYYFAISEP